MGAIVVRWNKDARPGQEEKNTPQANWLRNVVLEALIDNHPATFLAP